MIECLACGPFSDLIRFCAACLGAKRTLRINVRYALAHRPRTKPGLLVRVGGAEFLDRAPDRVFGAVGFQLGDVARGVAESASRLEGIGMRSRSIHWRISFSENRYPLFRDMR